MPIPHHAVAASPWPANAAAAKSGWLNLPFNMTIIVPFRRSRDLRLVYRLQVRGGPPGNSPCGPKQSAIAPPAVPTEAMAPGAMIVPTAPIRSEEADPHARAAAGATAVSAAPAAIAAIINFFTIRSPYSLPKPMRLSHNRSTRLDGVSVAETSSAADVANGRLWERGF